MTLDAATLQDLEVLSTSVRQGRIVIRPRAVWRPAWFRQHLGDVEEGQARVDSLLAPARELRTRLSAADRVAIALVLAHGGCGVPGTVAHESHGRE